MTSTAVGVLAAQLIVTLVWVVAPTSAFGQNVAVHVSGWRSEQIRRLLTTSLSQRVTVIEPALLDEALERDGKSLNLGQGNYLPPPPSFLQDALHAARAVEADAIMVAHADPTAKRRCRVRVVVIDGHTGEVLGEYSVTLPARLAGKKGRGSTSPKLFARRATKLVSQASLRQRITADSDQAPSTGRDDSSQSKEAVEEDAVEAVHGEATLASEKKTDSFAPALRVSAVLAADERRHTYTGVTAGHIRPYKIAKLPGFSLEVRWYPWSRDEGPLLSKIGFAGMYAATLEVDSEVADDPDTRISTRLSGWTLGPCVRLGTSWLELTVLGGLGDLSFAFSAPKDFAGRDELPSVAYLFVRAGGEVRARFAFIELAASGAYLHTLSSGHVGDELFPRSKKLGWQASSALSVFLSDSLSLLARGRYTRFEYSMNSAPDDAYQAKSGRDEYRGIELGLSQSF